MKTLSETESASTPKTIHQLVRLIASNALPSAARNNSFIVNEVPETFQIITDENILATVLSRLLYSLVNHAENCCIRVTAKEYDDIIFVYMKSTRGFDNDAIDSDLQQAQAYAKKMNGNVGLSRDEEKVTGIVFSFPNMNFNKNNATHGPENKAEAVSNQF
ncbi:MAG: hypothetical protein ABI741_11985 [Ferruginibacter sp.]